MPGALSEFFVGRGGAMVQTTMYSDPGACSPEEI